MNSSFIRNTLENLLKVKFKVQDMKDEVVEMSIQEEKETFCKLLNNIEKVQENEEKFYDIHGVNLESLSEPYWSIIEDIIDFMYLPETSDLIWWYLHGRKGPMGEIYEWTDENGTGYKFTGPEDLFEFIRYKYENRD